MRSEPASGLKLTDLHGPLKHFSVRHPVQWPRAIAMRWRRPALFQSRSTGRSPPFLSHDLSDAHEFGRNFKFTRLIQGVHHDRSRRQLVMNFAARLNSISEGHSKI